MVLTVLIGSLDKQAGPERKALVEHLANMREYVEMGVVGVCVKDRSPGYGNIRPIVKKAFEELGPQVYVNFFYREMSQTSEDEFRSAYAIAAQRDIAMLSLMNEAVKKERRVQDLVHVMRSRSGPHAPQILDYSCAFDIPYLFDMTWQQYFLPRFERIAKKASVEI